MLDNHVPTLETCQKLEAAGFPQESLFKWFNHYQTTGSNWKLIYENNGTYLEYLKENQAKDLKWCAAPLLTEILEQLPYGWINPDNGIRTSLIIKPKSSPYPLIGYYNIENKGNTIYCEVGNMSLIEAAALLWLKLNGGNNAKPE